MKLQPLNLVMPAKEKEEHIKIKNKYNKLSHILKNYNLIQ